MAFAACIPIADNIFLLEKLTLHNRVFSLCRILLDKSLREKGRVLPHKMLPSNRVTSHRQKD